MAAAFPRGGRPSPRSLIVGALIAVVTGVGLYFYVPGLWRVTTDDAYVNAHVVSIVPKVAAYVSKLYVNDNSKVARDELLIQLDPRDFQVAVDIANADLKSAQPNADNIEAQIREQHAVVAESKSAVDGDQALLDFAQEQFDRYKSLESTGAGTVERLQQAEADVGQRRATVQHDLAAYDAARAHQVVLETQELQAKAAVERQQAALAQAQLNPSYTKISQQKLAALRTKQWKQETKCSLGRCCSRSYRIRVSRYLRVAARVRPVAFATSTTVSLVCVASKPSMTAKPFSRPPTRSRSRISIPSFLTP
jgi:membrane fusion protein, multidrug efflux system